MKKVRRFYRRQDGVITTPSGVPVQSQYALLVGRSHEKCAEALCIKDMQKDFSKDSGTVSVNVSETTYTIVSWKIENLSVPSKKELNPLPPKPEYPETDTRNPKFWENKKRGK